jgi:hypothetical protein
MANKKTVVVKDNPDLVRDMSSKAIINTNTSAYEERLAQIEKERLDKQQSADIEVLKQDMADIKKMLKNLASK